jgi:translocation and assembly module TamA
MAEVTQKAEVDPERAAVQVTFDVRAGRRWRFGQIALTAEPSLPRDKILDQAGAAIKPGAYWDETKLAVARERVFKLGAFGGVRVERAEPDEENGTIAVVVSVEPAPFRTIRVGPGLGLSPIEWDVHALASWQNRNFFGDLRKFTLEGRIGYAWLPSPFRPYKRGPIGLFAVELGQPGALGRYIDVSTRIEVEKGIEQAYNFLAQRFRLSLPLRLAGRWTLVPSYSFELYELSDYGSVLTLTPGLTPTSGPIIQACTGSTCLLSYLEQVVAWDGRDNPLSAHRGVYVGISVQEGFHVASYGYRYLRFLPEARLFHPLFGQTVLALRLRVGALIPIAESTSPPVVALFAAGGPSSMRGYYARRLAPMVLQGSQWVPVGANGLADASIELRFPVTGNLGAAVFLDAASVSNTSASPSEWERALALGALQYGAGIGVRYLTPFGPLRVDVGVRLPDRLPLSPQAFPAVPFTAWPNGALHREPIVAIQLSVGEAF